MGHRDSPQRAENPNCAWCASADVITSSKFRSSGWEVLECRKCGTSFIWPRPSAFGTFRLYESAGNSGEDRQVAIRAAFCKSEVALAYLQMLPLSDDRPRRLLDVGCSTGAFLIAARRMGWDAMGIELDPVAADIARQVSNCRVSVGSVEDCLETLPEYDAVVMSHSLEHLTHPRSVLQMLTTHLAQGGHLLVRTPNSSSIAASSLGRTWPWFSPPSHLTFFSPQSFAALEPLGFIPRRILVHRGEARPLLVDFIFGLVKSCTGLRPYQRLGSSRAVAVSSPGRPLIPILARIESRLDRLLTPVFGWADSGDQEILAIIAFHRSLQATGV